MDTVVLDWSCINRGNRRVVVIMHSVCEMNKTAIVVRAS